MNKILTLQWIAVLGLNLTAQSADSDWKPVEGNIMTEWASQVDPANPLPEYPRPQLVREHWENLNGLWV